MTCAVLRQCGNCPPEGVVQNFCNRVKRMLIQSQTKEVGIGSKSHDLFGVDFDDLENFFLSQKKESNLFLVRAWVRGSTLIDTSPALNLAILSARNLPKFLARVLIIVECGITVFGDL